MSAPAAKRALSPALNPTGLGSAIAAIYAAVTMIANLVQHKGAYGFDPQVIVAAAGAAWLIYSRFLVTPVRDPKDAAGQPLIPVSAVATLKPSVPAPPSNVRVQPPPAAHP